MDGAVSKKSPNGVKSGGLVCLWQHLADMSDRADDVRFSG